MALEAKFHSLIKEKIFSYDTSRFPLRKCVEDMLGETELHLLHTTPAAQQWYTLNRFDKPYSNPFSKKLYLLSAEFKRTLQEFCMEVLGDILEGEQQYSWQVHPTFRVMFPQDLAVGIPHCDADYGHPRSEINVWVPFTRVYGSNTLYVESQPGAGDYHPIEADNGQALRFYGNQCRHHTLPNTSPATRVSMDLRVIPAFLYNTFPPTAMRAGVPKFKFVVGEYYAHTPGFFDAIGTFPVISSILPPTRSALDLLDDLIQELEAEEGEKGLAQQK